MAHALAHAVAILAVLLTSGALKITPDKDMESVPPDLLLVAKGLLHTADGNLTHKRAMQRALRNGSLATQGKLFRMKKQRSFAGGRPELLGEAHEKRVAAHRIRAREGGAPRCNSSNWAVVTTIFQPSAAVRAVGQLPGWCLVVVGDLAGPQQGEYLLNTSNVVHLSATDQREMVGRWQTLEHLPWRSFGRKNLGYLYALENGAKVVFDFDDDNAPLGGLQFPTAPRDNWSGEARVLSGAPFANVYPLFTATGATIWPRGYPLGAINGEGAPCCLSTKSVRLDTSRIGVVQSLAQGNPDVDAIYRLTEKLPVAFRDLPPVVLEAGTFSPFNAQATLWHAPAMAAMLLPVTVHGRVADILRSYVAQLFLWDADLRLAFASPMVEVSDRNPHDLMADFEAEWPLYYKTRALLEDLVPRRKSATQMPLEALFDTYVHLYEYGIVEEGDTSLAKAWVEDMASINPTLMARPQG